MSYENAPATELVATNCAMCSRPLVDAQSLSVGVGPVCRKKYAMPDNLTEEARKQANALIYQIAAHQHGTGAVEALTKLQELGLSDIAARIRKRLPYPVKISYEGDRFRVKTRYGVVEDWNGWVAGMLRTGGRYEGKGKGNTFPMSARRKVWELMRDHLSGMIALGPKGEINIQ